MSTGRSERAVSCRSGPRILGRLGLMPRSWPVKLPEARHAWILCARGGDRGGTPGRDATGGAGAARPASFGPSLMSRHYLPASSLTMLTGRKPMRVALYRKETVERHVHRKKEGVSQAEKSVRECCQSARPGPASALVVRRTPQVRRVAVAAGWADSEPQAGRRRVTAKHQLPPTAGFLIREPCGSQQAGTPPRLIGRVRQRSWVYYTRKQI
jgi:hypothetical protein